MELEELIAKAEPTSVSQHGPYGNNFLRPMRFPDVGSIVVGHKHNYDHITILIQGAILGRAWNVNEDGKQVMVAEKAFKAPAFMNVRAHRWHEFIALEANSYAVCVFALRTRDGEVATVDDEWEISCTE